MPKVYSVDLKRKHLVLISFCFLPVCFPVKHFDGRVVTA